MTNILQCVFSATNIIICLIYPYYNRCYLNKFSNSDAEKPAVHMRESRLLVLYNILFTALVE